MAEAKPGSQEDSKQKEGQQVAKKIAKEPEWHQSVRIVPLPRMGVPGDQKHVPVKLLRRHEDYTESYTGY